MGWGVVWELWEREITAVQRGRVLGNGVGGVGIGMVGWDHWGKMSPINGDRYHQRADMISIVGDGVEFVRVQRFGIDEWVVACIVACVPCFCRHALPGLCALFTWNCSLRDGVGSVIRSDHTNQPGSNQVNTWVRLDVITDWREVLEGVLVRILLSEDVLRVGYRLR
jgi:hypothetical protein